MAIQESGDITRAPCGECGEQISVEASVCPYCEYNPYKKQMGGGLGLLMIGALLSILIITAVVGIPLMLIGVLSMVRTWRQQPKPAVVD